jgi:hypothetical protein
MLYIGEIGRSLRTKFGEHRRAAIGNDAKQPVAKHFNTGIDSVSDTESVPSVPFLEERIATKDMKSISFPNMELSTPMALMNIILSKADIDSTLILTLIHTCFIYFVVYFVVFLIFVLVKSVM